MKPLIRRFYDDNTTEVYFIHHLGGSAKQLTEAREKLRRPDANKDSLAILRAQMIEEARKMELEKAEREKVPNVLKYRITLKTKKKNFWEICRQLSCIF
jgi:hypothetical protein